MGWCSWARSHGSSWGPKWKVTFSGNIWRLDTHVREVFSLVFGWREVKAGNRRGPALGSPAVLQGEQGTALPVRTTCTRQELQLRGIEWLQLMQILHLQSYIHIQLIVRFPSLPNLKYSPWNGAISLPFFFAFFSSFPLFSFCGKEFAKDREINFRKRTGFCQHFSSLSKEQEERRYQPYRHIIS